MLEDNIAMAEAIAGALRARRRGACASTSAPTRSMPTATVPLDEEACRAPGSLHGVMHLAREVMLGEAAGAAPFATLRPTLIYGAADPHNGYGPNRFRRLAAEGRDDRAVRRGRGTARSCADRRRGRACRAHAAAPQSPARSMSPPATVISFRDMRRDGGRAFRRAGGHQGLARASAPMPHNGYRPFDHRRRGVPSRISPTPRSPRASRKAQRVHRSSRDGRDRPAARPAADQAQHPGAQGGARTRRWSRISKQYGEMYFDGPRELRLRRLSLRRPLGAGGARHRRATSA